MALTGKAMMKMSAIGGIDASTCQSTSDDRHRHIKDWDGPDGGRHELSRRGVLLHRTLQSNTSKDQPDQHAAGVTEEHLRRWEVVKKESTERAGQGQRNQQTIRTTTQNVCHGCHRQAQDNSGRAGEAIDPVDQIQSIDRPKDPEDRDHRSHIAELNWNPEDFNPSKDDSRRNHDHRRQKLARQFLPTAKLEAIVQNTDQNDDSSRPARHKRNRKSPLVL